MIGKILDDPMNLDFSCDIQIVGSETGVKNTKSSDEDINSARIKALA